MNTLTGGVPAEKAVFSHMVSISCPKYRPVNQFLGRLSWLKQTLNPRALRGDLPSARAHRPEPCVRRTHRSVSTGLPFRGSGEGVSNQERLSRPVSFL